MIKFEKFIEICCDNRISLESLYILMNIQEAKDNKTDKVVAIIQSLLRKQLINEELEVTLKGQELLAYAISGEIIERVETKLTFHQELYKQLRDIIRKNTGASQAKMEIGKNKYYFLCSARDLEKTLQRFKREYPEMYNEKKIMEKLSLYVEKCTKERQYPMLVQYYIIHDKRGSALATAIENDEVEEVGGLTPKNIKNLFG